MTLTEARMRRLEAEAGNYIDRHDRGLSFEELARYRGRFPEFCRDLFGIELSPQQAEGAAALEEHRQVLVQGGNGVGKDTLTALWALFEIYVLGALALLSGPSDRQVREVLMRREIGRLWRLSKGKLPGERFEMAIRIPGREEGGLLAFTSTDPEKFVGHHSALGRVFLALTEGQGIPGEIYEAAQRCQPTRLLVVCNPTDPMCPAFGFSRSRAWHVLRWSALDHPNVATGVVKIPGAVTREWVDAMRLEHGEASRFWRHAVLADWPEESESSLVRRDQWERARARDQIRSVTNAIGASAEGLEAGWEPYILAVDPAREGQDRTSLVVRKGGLVCELHRWREENTLDNARRIEGHVRRLLRSGGADAVVVDEIALGGGIHDDLEERLRGAAYDRPAGRSVYRHQVQVVGFKSSRAAVNNVRFRDRRAEVFHHLGTRFERGTIAISEECDPDLAAELGEELIHHSVIYGADDRLAIGKKDEIRRTLGRSPDLADGLAMAFSTEVEEEEGYTFWVA